MNGKLSLCVLAFAGLVLSCKDKAPFSAEERRIITDQDSLMRVLVMPADSAVLRASSVDFGPAELASPLLETLLAKMLHTVQDPSQDGVGIAAPQVGLNRRAVCVQRFDKEGEPFEAYLNIRIDTLAGEVRPGPEGCLSVPGMRGTVPRFSRVVISYVRPGGSVRDRAQEAVEGFTAVIFQHECDHLDGILYTDKATELFAEE
ncbi:MAG: peptide deformylase [Bacteroidales bacterium]|nr:peptide deformylase [Bacteroidales bacterium]